MTFSVGVDPLFYGFERLLFAVRVLYIDRGHFSSPQTDTSMIWNCSPRARSLSTRSRCTWHYGNCEVYSAVPSPAVATCRYLVTQHGSDIQSTKGTYHTDQRIGVWLWGFVATKEISSSRRSPLDTRQSTLVLQLITEKCAFNGLLDH